MVEDNTQNDKNRYITASDYQELMEFLVCQFDKVNEKLDHKADKAEMEKILATKADKSDIDAVLTRATMLGNKIDDYRAEQNGLKSQVEKHEKWHFKTAAKAGINLLAE